MIKNRLKFFTFFCLTATIVTGVALVATLKIPHKNKVPYKNSEPNFEKIFYMSKLREQEGIESLKIYASNIDILAPQMYVVSQNLVLEGGLSSELTDIVRQHNMKVMPLLANDSFKQDIIHRLLVSPATQSKIIASMVNIALLNHFIGWQFDFENISWQDRDAYSFFIEKTFKVFKEKGLVLSVAAVVRDTDYEDTYFYKNWSGVFDYSRIANAVDFISLMTYDDPTSKGPSASVSFVKKSLKYAKHQIPPQKISLGIPLYYWGWDINTSKRVRFNGTYQRVIFLRDNFQSSSGFDDNFGVPWLAYTFNNESYKIWYEDRKSFEIKLDIAKQNNVRGFSAWVLGSEDPDIWSAI